MRALLHPKETFSKCTCTWKTLTVTGKSWSFLLNVCGRFVFTGPPAAYLSPPVQKKHQHRDPALPEGPPSCWAPRLPEVGGRPRCHGVKLLPQQPHLPQQRRGVHAHQDRHPELPAQQREPPPQPAAARRNPVQQVGRCRGDKEKVGHRHRQDEEEEEAVVAPADTAVEEEAVVVVVLDAQAAELAVFGAVGKKQLWVKVWRLGVKFCQQSPVIKQNHTSMTVKDESSLRKIQQKGNDACNDARKTPKNASDAKLVSYFTAGTEPVRTLVLLHQVGHAGEPGIRVRSLQLSRVTSQNLAEQAKEEEGVEHWHLHQRQAGPHAFKG